MSLRRIVHRLLALMQARRLDRELDDEILAHLELAERAGIAAGLSPEEARRSARRQFGHIEPMKEAHRDHRSARWIENLFKDLRYGLASLARDRMFAVVAICVLALGIGANTAMFSLVDAVLLKPLPFPEPEQIVKLWEAPTPTSRNGIATLNFLDWKRSNQVFVALSAQSSLRAAVDVGGEPTRMTGRLVSADYFDVFGIEARIGRTFAPGEDEPGAPPVVIVSHAAWQSRFGGDPRLLNTTIAINGEAHTVIGILPPGSFDRESAAFWKPLVFTPEQRTRDYHWLTAVGRLKPGVDLAEARREMLRIGEETSRVSPLAKRDWRVFVEPFDARLVGDELRRSLYVTFGAVVLVLLIACANVSNLLLTKSVARRKEMAVRAALGASRGRLTRQLLTEVAVLCLLGGLAGIGLALVFSRAAASRFADVLPPTASVHLDLRALAFTTGIAFVVTIGVGLLPAFRASSTTLTDALGQAGRGNSGGSSERMRRFIVSGEVALSLILLCGAALLFRSLLELQRVDTGARADNVITASADLPQRSYATPDRATQFFDAVDERLSAVPGIALAAVSTDLPLRGVSQYTGLNPPGSDERVDVAYKRVGPEYFGLLDIPFVAGRGLDRRDRAGAPRVLVINEALAARLKGGFGIHDPIGRVVRAKEFSYDRNYAEVVEWTIVGVIRNERVEDMQSVVEPVVYVPLAQVPRREIKLVIRTVGEPALAMSSIREAIRQLDPNVPVGDVRTMMQIEDESLAGARAPTQVVGAFAAVAGLLAALGLYGVLSQVVAQRRREIGIRMALGARAHDVLALVLGNAARIVVVGLVLGVAGVLALSRAIEGLLFQVSPFDPGTLASACAAMTVIALLAAAIPARRASSVNPLTALREEG